MLTQFSKSHSILQQHMACLAIISVSLDRNVPWNLTNVTSREFKDTHMHKGEIFL